MSDPLFGIPACWNPSKRQPHRPPLHLHHSLAAAGLEAGISLAELAAVLRHTNARVTAQVYAGLTDRAREQATAKLAETGFGQ